MKTVKTYKSVFKQILDLALEDEIISKNPFIHIRLKKTQKPDIVPFTKKEVDEIIASADGWFKNYIALAFYSGMRAGELLGLRWEDISFQERYIFVRHSIRKGEFDTTKTGEERFVPILDVALPYLKDQFHITGLMNGFVFCHENGKPFKDSSSFLTRWKNLLRRAGVPYRKFHTTRHTLATTLLSSGLVSVNEVAAILGHSTVQTTLNTYNRFAKNEAVKIDRSINPFENPLENRLEEEKKIG